ncbi:helix-turn-helix domain-containing protein [Pelagerythrobacter sp.]|uniref:helix-turn-helix domain-containing protein n=1 Tax=Pelagerythrobacter sp. TaxID=2800702 RepID=UPI0035AF8AFD
MTPTQSRMARAALKWSLTDLATAAKVGRATVARFELGETVGAASVEAMAKALSDAGAKFAQRADRVSVSVPARENEG